MKSIFNESHKKYMTDNYLTMSYKEIGDNIGFSERQIRGWLNNNGYTKLRKINDNYFSSIDTPLKAYFLGFIYADGWVYTNEKARNYELGIELQSEDKYILERLNDELGGLNIICHYNPKIRHIKGVRANCGHSDVLRVYSKPLVLDLIRNGVERNKTQKDIYPVVPDDLFFDWLRGYIDGDGCFYNNQKTTSMHITCSTQSPLKYIQSKLKEYGIMTSIYEENPKKHRLTCTNKNSLYILVNRLYYEDGLFCLKRKYEKVKHLLGSAA